MSKIKIAPIILKEKNKDLTEADKQIRRFFNVLLKIVENSGKSQQDCILLAGAMISVAKLLYYDNFTNTEANDLMEANLGDLVGLLNPTIH
tara:strand:- start:13 stop:285 length:273 start_codon:yes stop_codon:yes gene_type:complete